MEYTVELLRHGIRVCVNSTHRFGTDAFLLSHFCHLKYAETALDIGTGCGIIPLRWKDCGHKGIAVGLEIDKEGTQLLETSIALGCVENLTALCGDVRTFNCETQFDVISCNPPYFTAGKTKNDDKKASFRHQLTLTDMDVAAAAYRLLKDNGRLCVCQRPDQLAQVIFAMKTNRIEPKQLRFVRQRKDSEAPWLVLVDGRKNGGKSLKILPDLFIEDGDGNFSEELQKIYGKL